MAYAQRYNPDTFGMDWYDTETGAAARYSRPGSGDVMTNGGWNNAQFNPFTQGMGEKQPEYDAAQAFAPAGGWTMPTAKTPWFMADGKYIIPEMGLDMDDYDGLAKSRSYVWGGGGDKGTLAHPSGTGTLYKLPGGQDFRSGDKSGTNAPYTYGRAYDTAPEVTEWSREPEETALQALMGGPKKPWWGGSPGAAFAGAFGALAGAASAASAAGQSGFGAMGAGTSALGGVEAAGALGGSLSGAGGSALSLADLIPSWAQNIGSNSPGINGGSFNLNDWWSQLGNGAGAADLGQSFPGLEGMSGYDAAGNYSLAGNAAEVPWGVNRLTGGGMDDEMGGFWDMLSGGNSSNGGNFTTEQLLDPSYWNELGGTTGLAAPGAAGVAGSTSTYGGSSLLDRLKSLQQSTGLSTKDAISMLGKLGAAGLQSFASNKQAGALSGLAGQYAEMGAPYRGMLASSYANPSTFLANDPSIQASVNQGTSALARALSTTGNPAQSGRTLQELQNYATNTLYGQLGNERSRLANFGGLANYTSAVPTLQSQAIGANSNIYSALGAGLGTATAPDNTLESLLKQLQGMGIKLNNGTSL